MFVLMSELLGLFLLLILLPIKQAYSEGSWDLMRCTNAYNDEFELKGYVIPRRDMLDNDLLSSLESVEFRYLPFSKLNIKLLPNVSDVLTVIEEPIEEPTVSGLCPTTVNLIQELFTQTLLDLMNNSTKNLTEKTFVIAVHEFFLSVQFRDMLSDKYGNYPLSLLPEWLQKAETLLKHQPSVNIFLMVLVEKPLIVGDTKNTSKKISCSFVSFMEPMLLMSADKLISESSSPDVMTDMITTTTVPMRKTTTQKSLTASSWFVVVTASTLVLLLILCFSTCLLRRLYHRYHGTPLIIITEEP